MNYIITCGADPEFPFFFQLAGTDYFTIKCSDSTVPQFSPVYSGLSELPWSDVTLLIGALLLSCSIAAGINLLTRMFYRG
ncbi:MAG: hypothetical protein R3E36_05350 [Nitrosomonas sp.]|nr:hypothetical protein [Nitrosomonas sp.]